MSTYVLTPGREYQFAVPQQMSFQVTSAADNTACEPIQFETYIVNATTSSNTVTWNNYWAQVDTPTNDTYRFMFSYAGTNVEPFTGNFAPLGEEMEVDPPEFFRFLERLGHDDAYLRLQDAKQRELFEREGIVPPWDPEHIRQMEVNRLLWEAGLERERKEKLQERFGIEDLPPITPELIDQIKENSRKFLEQWLSPAELKMYDKEGHIIVPSTLDPEVIYIVKKGVHSRIERYEKGELAEQMCYVSAWGGIPHDDIIAMKVFDLKHNEEQVLEVAVRSRVRH